MSFTVPSKFIFHDVSSGKEYRQGTTVSVTLANGDYLSPEYGASHTEWYYFYKSDSTWGGYTIENGWRLVTNGRTMAPSMKKIAGYYVRQCLYNNVSGMTSIPDLSEHTNLRSVLFYNCTKLTNYSTSRLPTSLTTMNAMFYGCTALKTAPSLAGFTSVKDISRIFRGCTSLVTAPKLPPNVTKAVSSFENCTNLTTITSWSFTNTNVEMWNAFAGCVNLESFPHKIATTNYVNSMFEGCSKLTGVIIFTLKPVGTGDIFKSTKKSIYLFGDGVTSAMQKSSQISNVYIGFKTDILSFITIRCDDNGNEDPYGNHCRLYLDYKLDPVIPSYLNPVIEAPALYSVDADAEIPLELSWYIGNDESTALIPGSTDLNNAGRINATISNISDIKDLKILMNTSVMYDSETYDWSSEAAYSTFTIDIYPIDINAKGTSVGIMTTASDEEDDFIVGDESQTGHARIRLATDFSKNVRLKGHEVPVVKTGTTRVTIGTDAPRTSAGDMYYYTGSVTVSGIEGFTTPPIVLVSLGSTLATSFCRTGSVTTVNGKTSFTIYVTRIASSNTEAHSYNINWTAIGYSYEQSIGDVDSDNPSDPSEPSRPVEPTLGLPDGGNNGDVLVKSDDYCSWEEKVGLTNLEIEDMLENMA